MGRILNTKSKELFLFMEQLFDKGKTAWIVVSGWSMYPFLRENLDMVELERAEFSKVKKGDIVLIKRQNGDYVLHRVLKKNNAEFFLIGDAQQRREGPLKANQLKAIVRNIKRKDKVISCHSPWLKVLVSLWFFARPVRNKLIRVFGPAKGIES